MPGPNSAPNGDRSLVEGQTYVAADRCYRRTREVLRNKGKLFTGKTAAKRTK